ncbi:MAG TPA: Rad52/Rad22 family DNA repair protein [Candidatus Sulfotelmatobacter sp.]|nr:Rad52/Rad22 family DNA repair protein [Candidatus Sulfotelmatobacter sp.]
MNVPTTQGVSAPSTASPPDLSDACGERRQTKVDLNEVLRALAIPFELTVVQWRVTEWSDGGTRGLMLPYADPRAYSDRLNDLLTPAGWSRKYTVQTSAPVQRTKRGPAAKILVTCEVTIACIGTNSGTGEEWSDKENALTAAEAQAFKRALSLFGLGRYLYDIDGEWVDLDRHGAPTRIPRLPRWATPNGWLAGLRPKLRRNRRALVRANGHADNGRVPSLDPSHQANGKRQSVVLAIEAMENKIGKRFYRGLLKNVARAWSPHQIQETAVLEKVLAQMQGAERGIARLDAAQAKLAPEAVQRIISSLNAPPAKLEDLQTLHALVMALEKELDGETHAG